MQARFTVAREHARYGRRLARRTAAAAAAERRTAAAADVTVVPETANEAPPVKGGLYVTVVPVVPETANEAPPV